MEASRARTGQLLGAITAEAGSPLPRAHPSRGNRRILAAVNTGTPAALHLRVGRISIGLPASVHLREHY
jgi:hypothetical protein